MIVTEEEAKTKACQERVQREHMPQTYNPREFNCIGSACMAWRWRGWIGEAGDPNEPGTAIMPTKCGVNSQRYGYCGKAGRP